MAAFQRRANQVEIVLPTFHPDQIRAYEAFLANRFLKCRCGRRWGKSELGVTIGADYALKGRSVGFFAPDYKILQEDYHGLASVLDPVILQSSQVSGVIRTSTNGRVDFWTTENERAGRSRKYHLVVLEESAFSKSNMLSIWEKSIKPTLLDYGGKALVLSNTNGASDDNFLYQLHTRPELGFVDFHAPTRSNPYLPPDDVARLREDNHPLVYLQEYEAEFVDWSGVAFFASDSLLRDGQPVDPPKTCDYVFATIDTAIKTGKDNDGTAVCFWALDRLGVAPWRLTVLDWDYVQVEGGSLETWLPGVFVQLEQMARECRARQGSAGAWIEDKGSGTVLIQQARRHEWPAHEIDVKLTNMGKSERALSVSGYVHRGLIKMARAAFDRLVVFKGVSRNHLLSQLAAFRVDSKEQIADDVLDTFMYGVAIGLGDDQGY